MTNEVALLSHDTLAALVVGGDLSKLTQQQKVEYYIQFCVRIGLDPATQPFKILKFQGKEMLYAGRECSAQLCKLHKVSHQIVSRERFDDLSVVTAKAMTPDGRCTESIGAVSIIGLKGEALANALMKAETKAKRRATLDLLGLGLLDETEADTIPGAVQIPVQTDATVIEPEQPSAPIAQTTEQRNWRAWVNKQGQACKTLDHIALLITESEKRIGNLDLFTGHNETETYRSLIAEHATRISEDMERKSPEGIARWVELVKKSKNVKDLADFVKVFKANEYLHTQEVETALQDVADDLEIKNFHDLVA